MKLLDKFCDTLYRSAILYFACHIALRLGVSEDRIFVLFIIGIMGAVIPLWSRLFYGENK